MIDSGILPDRPTPDRGDPLTRLDAPDLDVGPVMRVDTGPITFPDAGTAMDAPTDLGAPMDVPDDRSAIDLGGSIDGPFEESTMMTGCALRTMAGACMPGVDPGCDIVQSCPGEFPGGPCAVFAGGAVRCWSTRASERVFLGNGTERGCIQPGLVRDLTGVQAVQQGRDFACVVRTGQAMPVWCWGENRYAQLGMPTPGRSLSPIPTTIPSGTLELGGETGFSITAPGVVTAWGNNQHGQHGDGTVANLGVAPHIVNLPGLQQLDLAAGNGYTACGVFTGGEVRCWGMGSAGHFGTAITPIVTTTRSPIPLTVPGITHAREVRISGRFACALRTDATMWCWGLGNNPMMRGAGTTPTQVLDRVTQIALGGSEACALRTDGTVWCWGDASGVGNGGSGGTLVADPVQVGGLTGVQRLYVGAATRCAWRGGHDLRCWGQAAGAGSSGESGVPVAMVW